MTNSRPTIKPNACLIPGISRSRLVPKRSLLAAALMAWLVAALPAAAQQTDAPQQVSQTTDKSLGQITGRVTRADTGESIALTEIQLWSDFGGYTTSRYTDASGFFVISASEGEHFLTTANQDGFLDELFDDIPCPGGGFFGCDVTSGTLITVDHDGVVEVEFRLEVGGTISGTVVSSTDQPVAGALIQIWNVANGLIVESYSDDQGRYRASGLSSGSYFVTVRADGAYFGELFDEFPCPGGGCDPTVGTPVQVVLGQETPGIDFELDQLGSISGSVTDEAFGDPIPMVLIEIVNADGNSSYYAISEESGSYRSPGLTDGTYFLRTSNLWGFDDELYDDLPYGAPTNGTPVVVDLNQETSGIDFALAGGCVRSDSTMCLNYDRFRVSATWRTLDGTTGVGNAVKLTQDSGYFWFFGDDNIEMVVKVLDACSFPGANNFWVFATGLTDVEVTLTVADMRTGTLRTYVNPLGTPFQPIQDTSAFDTCP